MHFLRDLSIRSRTDLPAVEHSSEQISDVRGGGHLLSIGSLLDQVGRWRYNKQFLLVLQFVITRAGIYFGGNALQRVEGSPNARHGSEYPIRAVSYCCVVRIGTWGVLNLRPLSRMPRSNHCSNRFLRTHHADERNTLLIPIVAQENWAAVLLHIRIPLDSRGLCWQYYRAHLG